MNTRKTPSDPGLPDDLESRIARTPFVAPPRDLRDASLSGAARPAVEPAGAPLWRRVWEDLFAPHPLLATSLAAAWIAIFGLWFSTPDVGRPATARHARVPEEDRRAVARQRAKLMASLSNDTSEESDQPRETAAPQRQRAPSPATKAPRSSLSMTNRLT